MRVNRTSLIQKNCQRIDHTHTIKEEGDEKGGRNEQTNEGTEEGRKRRRNIEKIDTRV